MLLFYRGMICLAMKIFRVIANIKKENMIAIHIDG